MDWPLIIFGTHVVRKKRQIQSVFLHYISVSYDYLVIKYLTTQKSSKVGWMELNKTDLHVSYLRNAQPHGKQIIIALYIRF